MKKIFKGFKEGTTRFVLVTACKIIAVPLTVSFFTAYLFWFLISLNNLFFESNGYEGYKGLKEAYFEFIIGQFLHIIPYFALFILALFFVGIYIAKMLLRPFQAIGDYCESAANDKNTPYSQDFFSEYKVLTRFSEFFFSYLLNCRNNGILKTNTVPPQYTKIRKPVFDKTFFLHFSLIIAIVGTVSVVFINAISTSIHESTVQLASETLKTSSFPVRHFLLSQSYLAQSISTITIIGLVVSYIVLTFNLYNKVAPAAFGFFATMRSFMNGNFSARVHLIGYSYIRPYSLQFNKYLDAVTREMKIDNAQENKPIPINVANNK